MASDTKIRSWCAIINYRMIVSNGISAAENEISQNILEIPLRERAILMRSMHRLIDKQMMVTLARKAKIMIEGMDAALNDELNVIAIILDEVGVKGIANDVMCRIIKTHIEDAVHGGFDS